MSYQIRTVSIIFIAILVLSSAARASRCLKPAENQAITILKKAGHSESSQARNTMLVKSSVEAKRVYRLTPQEELYSTEVWEGEDFAVYDVIVEGETCRLKMVRAGGI